MKAIIILISMLLYTYTVFAQNQDFEKETAIQLNERAAFFEVGERYELRKDTIFHGSAGFILNPNYDVQRYPNGEEYLILTYPEYECKEKEKNCRQYIERLDHVEYQRLKASRVDSIPVHVDIVERTNGSTTYRNGIRLAIKKTDFDLLKKTNYYSRKGVKFSSGILTVPFKFRPEKDSTEFILSTDATIGAYGGVTFRLSKTQRFYVTLPVTLGLSFININDNNTSNTEPQGNPSGIVPGITWSAGVIFQLSDFNIGIVVGQDFASGVGNKWMYNGEPWFSFAIGYNFLKQEKS